MRLPCQRKLQRKSTSLSWSTYVKDTYSKFRWAKIYIQFIVSGLIHMFGTFKSKFYKQQWSICKSLKRFYIYIQTVNSSNLEYMVVENTTFYIIAWLCTQDDDLGRDSILDLKGTVHEK